MPEVLVNSWHFLAIKIQNSPPFITQLKQLHIHLHTYFFLFCINIAKSFNYLAKNDIIQVNINLILNKCYKIEVSKYAVRI